MEDSVIYNLYLMDEVQNLNCAGYELYILDMKLFYRRVILVSR